MNNIIERLDEEKNSYPNITEIMELENMYIKSFTEEYEKLDVDLQKNYFNCTIIYDGNCGYYWGSARYLLNINRL